MTELDLSGCAILIVQKDLPTALDLQDAFAGTGARLLTSYRPSSALQHAEVSQLSAAVIDASLDVEERNAICKRLAMRNVPYVLYRHIPSFDVAGRRAPAARPIDAVEQIAEIVGTNSDTRHDGRSLATRSNTGGSAML